MEVVCKVIAGSHLFGTNRPESDMDYKGVYIPKAEDILMGTVKDTINMSTGDRHGKNGKDDIDIEMYSLKKFFEMIYSANNHALEILFAPDEMIVESSYFWDNLIRPLRETLVCSKVKNYITYCQSQAAKYGVRGSRVNAVEKAMDALSRGLAGNTRLVEMYEDLEKNLKDTDHISFLWCPKEKLRMIEVANRKFMETIKVRQAYEILGKIYDNYGARAKAAANNEGIDWKAISHAYRVGVQSYELLRTGKITLPIPEPHRSYIRKIKNNDKELTIPYSEVSPVLDELAENLEEEAERSSLPSQVNEEIWNNWVMFKYGQVVREWVDYEGFLRRQPVINNSRR